MSDPLAEVLALEAEGLLFSAHDRAMAALSERPDDAALRWFAANELPDLGIPAPIRTLLNAVLDD